MKRNIQLGLLALLVLTFVYVNARNLWSSGRSTVPLAASADELEDPLAGRVTIPDAELRLDLLETRPRFNPNSPRRNIFTYGPIRPQQAEETRPEPVEIAQPVDPPPPTPLPPPRSPLVFFGIAEFSEGGGPLTVFLSDGQDVYSARESSIILKRYRVSQIRQNSLELEDTRTGQRWVLWLEVEREP